MLWPEVSNVTIWNQNIFDLPIETMIGDWKNLPIVLFSFDALFPRELLVHIYDNIFKRLPIGSLLISTWSPHFYQVPAANVLDSLFIGPPGVMESDTNVVINLALSPDNYPTEEFERLDEVEQLKQLAAAKTLTGKPELPIQMEEFTMFCYTL